MTEQKSMHGTPCCARCRRGMPGMGGSCGQPACRCHNPVQERCRAFLGSDRCEDVAGHEGDHRAMWGGGVQCRWADDYELNRYMPDATEPLSVGHQFDGEPLSPVPSVVVQYYQENRSEGRTQ